MGRRRARWLADIVAAVENDSLRIAALAKAAAARSAWAKAAQALADGEVDLPEFIARARSDGLLSGMKIFKAVSAVPGLGKVGAGRWLARHQIEPTTQVGELTADQAAALGAYRGRLLVVSGPSGVGKGTVVDALARHLPFRRSVSVTTRPARPQETNGDHYQFVSEHEFDRMVNEGKFLEWAEYANHRYGTPRDPVEAALADGEDILLEIEVQGVRQVKRAYPEAVTIFLEPPSLTELEARITKRGGTQGVAARLQTARRELAAATEFRYRIVNDDLKTTVEQLLSILRPA